MTPDTLDAIREHALAEYPRECCGLVAIVKGRERYIPCRNQAETASEHFILHPEDYANADEQGEIVAVVHSHPDVAARPSEADRVACEASGLPWLICSVIDGAATEVCQFEPAGYEAPLVGRSFHHGVLDCYTLIRDFYARELGITLPDFVRPDNWWNDGHSNLYLDHFRDAGCEPIPDGDPMQRGDIILMQIRSQNGVPNHAAVYLGDGLILHHLYGRLSSRDVYGGQWSQLTRLIVRHASATLGGLNHGDSA